MSDITINTDQMKKFLLEFQPTYFKYFGENRIPKEFSDNKIVEAFQKILTDIYRTDMCRSVSSAELLNVYNIVDKVYADSAYMNDYSFIFMQIQEKLVDEFVGIKGIYELYHPLFFVFEWMMHLEYKPETDSYSYYRDHFVHQVRNMYEMFMLLQDPDMNLLDKCIQTFEKSGTLLARRMRCAVLKEKKEFSEMKLLSTINAYIKESGCNIDAEDFLKRSIYRYILTSSTVVTSLVHDIGYPMQFLSKNLDRMEKFLPISTYFFEKKDETPRLHAILQNSLLYQTVNPREISERIQKGDHGTVSACILLLSFYMDGRIYSLSHIQQMIIELSALTIYEHNLKYGINGRESTLLYQNVFEKNPFSFLFRLCDDIQEWDRTYFDITKQSNFLVCDKCRTIIRKSRLLSKGKQEPIYYCCCGKKGQNYNLFKYRKLAQITACTDITIKKSNRCYELCMNYNLMRLLQASAYNAAFAQKRAEALADIKRMVIDQNGMVPIYVNAFISNNPIAIKTEIIRQYMRRHNKILKYKKHNFLEVVSEIFNANIPQVIVAQILADAWSNKTGLRRKSYAKLLKENLCFYIRLATIQEYIFRLLKGKEKHNCIKEPEIQEAVAMICRKDRITEESLRLLILDFFEQIVKTVDKDQFEEFRLDVKDAYFSMFLNSNQIVSAVESYVFGPLYDEVCVRCAGDEEEKQWIEESQGAKLEYCRYDFYSDYWIFQQIYNKI